MITYGTNPGMAIPLTGRVPMPATPEDVEALLHEALGRASVRDAAAEVAARLDLPRREVYARALALSRGDDAGEEL